MSSSIKKRLLKFIEFQFDLRIGISKKGIWQFELSITNDLIAANDETDRVNAIGFVQPSKGDSANENDRNSA